LARYSACCPAKIGFAGITLFPSGLWQPAHTPEAISCAVAGGFSCIVAGRSSVFGIFSVIIFSSVCIFCKKRRYHCQYCNYRYYFRYVHHIHSVSRAHKSWQALEKRCILTRQKDLNNKINPVFMIQYFIFQ